MWGLAIGYKCFLISEAFGLMSGPSRPSQGSSEVRDGSGSDDDWLRELCLPGEASCSAGSASINNNRDCDAGAGDMEVDSLERLLHEDDCSGEPSQLSLKELMAAGAEFCTERSFRRFESAASGYNDNPVAAADGPFMMVDGHREQLVSTNYYKMLAPASLHWMPRLEPVMRAVLQDPTILIEFSPTNQLASRVLSHAEGRIRMLHSSLLTYKIGLTADPAYRWRKAEHAYCREIPKTFATMRLLAILEYGESAAYLEASLISTFNVHPACKNIAAGGESASKMQRPFFVYAVASA